MMFLFGLGEAQGSECLCKQGGRRQLNGLGISGRSGNGLCDANERIRDDFHRIWYVRCYGTVSQGDLRAPHRPSNE